jgi:hypothetical protein
MWVTDAVKLCNNIHILIEEQDYYLIDLYSKQYFEVHKNGWEQTRVIAYITAQCQSSKKIKADEFIPFAWNSQKQKGTEKIDREQKRKMLEKMKKWEQKGQ